MEPQQVMTVKKRARKLTATKLKKRKVKSTPRQRKAAALVLQGKTPTEAAREAGYSENTVKNVGNNIVAKRGFQEIITALPDAHILAGNTPEFVAGVTHDLMTAKDVKIVGNGEDAMAIDVPMYSARAKGVELWLKQMTEPRRMNLEKEPVAAVHNTQVNVFVGRDAVSSLIRGKLNVSYGEQHGEELEVIEVDANEINTGTN